MGASRWRKVESVSGGASMLRMVCAVVGSAVIWTAPVHAQEAAPEPERGRVMVDTVVTRALAGNLLHDPIRQPVQVYVPPGYDRQEGRRYPVLYLLHGVLDDPTVWVEPVYQGMTIDATMDSLVVAGEIAPFLVVMPNGNNAYGGSLWVNSSVTGRWEDYVARDVVAHVDTAYRTIARPESRAVAGHSMGGYGAIRLGMHHPDVFSIVWGMAPCCLCCMERDVGPELAAWDVLDGARSADDLWNWLDERDDPWPLIVAAGSAALSPRPDVSPWHFRAPFEKREDSVVATGALSEWDSASAVVLASQHAEGLRGLRGLGFAAGYDDQFRHIPVGVARLSDTLRALEVGHTVELYDGDHRNRVRERMSRVVLPWIDSHLSRDLLDPPRAVVRDGVLEVETWPPVALRPDSALKYVGSSSFALYGVAEADTHLFVEADPDGVVQRMYWIQVEAARPTTDFRYDYSFMPLEVELGGRVYSADVRFGLGYSLDEEDPESDVAQVLRLLHRNGYRMPEEIMRARMVTLDEARRRELLVIYLESLDLRNLSAVELEGDDGLWRDVAESLLERASADIDVR